MDQIQMEYFVLTAVKDMWDQGMRNSKSPTGRFFTATDVTMRGNGELYNIANQSNHRQRDDDSKAIGRCLTRLSGLKFKHNGITSYVDKYVVGGVTVYRFVELE